MRREGREVGLRRCISLLIVLLFAATALLQSGCKKERKAEAAPAPPVEVTEVIQRDVPIFSEWIASIDGSVNATIRAQVQGYLIRQLYREGEVVTKGQVLFEIDPRSFQALLDETKATWNKAKAALDQSRADVARAEAQYATSKAALDRVRPLAEMNAVSKKDLDDALGAERSAQALLTAAQSAVEAAKATILATRAAVEKTELDVDFTRIVSPITGIAGIAKAQIGNLVGPGSIEELTTVSTVDPIKVYVPMSEQEYLSNAKKGRNGTGDTPLELILADGSVHPKRGRFAFADRQVDVRTGTLKVAALFANPGNLLRPGQFARVRAQMTTKRGALLVPQRAVSELQGSFEVAVVGTDNRVEIRPVVAAQRIRSLWIIDQGLRPGERVVAEGIQKVKQGMTVHPTLYRTRDGIDPMDEARKDPDPAPEKNR